MGGRSIPRGSRGVALSAGLRVQLEVSLRVEMRIDLRTGDLRVGGVGISVRARGRVGLLQVDLSMLMDTSIMSMR